MTPDRGGNPNRRDGVGRAYGVASPWQESARAYIVARASRGLGADRTQASPTLKVAKAYVIIGCTGGGHGKGSGVVPGENFCHLR
jgi:hypothetical protein